MRHSLLTVVFQILLIYSKSTHSNVSKVQYYVTPSPHISCSRDPCLTLSQFTANSSHYIENVTEVSLVFLPGNHSLDRELSVSDTHNFSMELESPLKSNEPAFIKCANKFARFVVNDTTFTSIKGLHFIACHYNIIKTVEDTLLVEDTIFQGVEGESGGRALILAEVNDTMITNCSFISNSLSLGIPFHHYYAGEDEETSDPLSGGALFAARSSVLINSTRFVYNTALIGGALVALSGEIAIINSTFSYNRGDMGGTIYTVGTFFYIVNSTFSNNAAMLDVSEVGSSTFDEIYSGGAIMLSIGLCFIDRSIFTNNTATNNGGAISALYFAGFIIMSSIFTNNSAAIGGVMSTLYGYALVNHTTFTSNTAASWGGVAFLFTAPFETQNLIPDPFHFDTCIFTYNKAVEAGGVIYSIDSLIDINNGTFSGNTANGYGGIMFTKECTTNVTDSTFISNSGSLYTLYGNIHFSGYSMFENCVEPTNKTFAVKEGGAVTCVLSTVIFNGETSLLNNKAMQGGAILASDSTTLLYGTLIIANNTATNSSGGGISLQQSILEIRGNCTVYGNYAMRGGGVHAKSSVIGVHQQGILKITNNTAKSGGGLYLEINPRLYAVNYPQSNVSEGDILMMFTGNHANYGGAVYVADDANAGACSSSIECFIQTMALQNFFNLTTLKIHLSENTANKQGANLFGGLLDRCVPSPLTKLFHNTQASLRSHYDNGIAFLEDVSNISLNTISSLPVRVCFCKSDSEPDCSYQPPPIKVKKGEMFNVSLVAVDQVNHSVEANIISSPASPDGGFSEGQQAQRVGRCCSNLTFNVFSPHDSETINLYADGPCGGSTPSLRQLGITFLNCLCPVGFQPSNTDLTTCDCICDSRLPFYFTKCDYKTSSIVRENTNSWITYVNDTDPRGYVIHPNCPYDYCHPQTVNVSINLNLRNGADVQCMYNRTGTLCGGCQEHLSLSLGSSRCLPCPNYSPAVFVMILLSAIIAGLLLVITLLALDLTVAVGAINGFIFYANIVAANSAVFFPSSEPSFPTVFVAWLNLDLGIDVCFINNLDTYSKTWLQLAFPVYIISLVIVICENSSRYARLIGRKDPIATLATLILMSYSKLLSVTITVLSFAVIRYPDGSQEIVWLPDGNVKYFEGKHIFLVIVTVFVILIGSPYTFLLLLWQLIIRVPIRWKVFNWTRNTKLFSFISTYHAPHNSMYRYWTGLLLLVRVVLYITSSVTVSDNPQASILITAIVIGALILHKCITKTKVYKKTVTEIIDTIVLVNLLALALFSLYNFKTDYTKQTAVAYTSTTVTFLLLVGVIVYHIILAIIARKTTEVPPAILPTNDAVALLSQQDVTYSVVDITNSDQSLPSEHNSDLSTPTAGIISM